jgi:tetratricopeptide (TPR) repeat protein
LTVWLTFTFALFCKETAAFLPFVLLVYFVTLAPNRKITWKYILLGTLMGCSGIIWLYLRSLYSLPVQPVVFKDFLTTFLSIPVVFSKLIALPVDFSPLLRFTAAKVIVGLLVLTFVFFFVFKKTKRPVRENLFYISWFLLFLIPNFFGINPNNKGYFLEHRYLLPMIGVLFLFLSVFPKSTPEKDEIKTPGVKDFMWIGILILFAVVSFFKTDVYREPLSYYGAIIKYNPNIAMAYNNRGLYRQTINDTEGALEDFNKAISCDNEYSLAYENRGIYKETNNDTKGALDDYSQAILYDKKNAAAYYNRGSLKQKTGDLQGALEDYNQSIFYNKKNAYTYLNRCFLKNQTGDVLGAIDDFNQAIAIDKGFADAYNTGLLKHQVGGLSGKMNDSNEAVYYNIRGLWKGQKGDFVGAMDDFGKAIKLKDDFVEAYTNRSAAKNMMKDFQGALDDVNKALSLRPDDLKAYYNRAVLYQLLGNYEKALQDCNRILEIQPNDELTIRLKELIISGAKN